MSLSNLLFGIETNSEREVREHNEGQKDGSKADGFDRMIHNISGGGSDHYNMGHKNGTDNPSSKDDNSSDSSDNDKSSSWW